MRMEKNQKSYYLKKLGEGDHQAFDGLFTYYHPRVRSFLAGFLKDDEMAGDLAQDLFFKVWLHRETIATVASFSGYLFRMARNMVYDYYDRHLIQEKYDRRLYTEGSIRGVCDPVEEELYARELSLLIDLAIEKMPPQRKRIFLLSRKQGLSNEEIAQRMQISKRTVENHITQALNDLRRIILAFAFFCFKYFS